MKQLPVLLLIAICLNASSQQMGYRNGLIITQTNDTIICLVPIESSFGEKVTIKRNTNSNEEDIPLKQIKYLVTETNVYENIVFRNSGKEIQKLMWLEIEGKLNLYLEAVINTRGSGSGGQISFFGPPIKTYVIRKADSTYLIDEKHFVNTIKPVISDNPDLMSKVEKKVYKFDSIEALVKEYNQKTMTD